MKLPFWTVQFSFHLWFLKTVAEPQWNGNAADSQVDHLMDINLKNLCLGFVDTVACINGSSTCARMCVCVCDCLPALLLHTLLVLKRNDVMIEVYRRSTLTPREVCICRHGVVYQVHAECL